MPFYERGDVRIHYEEAGSGFPLLLIPGGGLNSSISVWAESGPFDAMEEFKDEYRCITMDLRNANAGQSSGPLQLEDAWQGYADDQLGLMDHLGIDEFLVLGCCIGGPFILKLIETAPSRVVAAVLCQPSGHRPENPDVMWNNNTTTWGPALCARRPGDHDGHGEGAPDQPLPLAARLRLQRDARLRAVGSDAAARDAGRRAGAPVPGLDGHLQAGAQRRGLDVPLEAAEGADPGGGRARAYLPARAHAGDGEVALGRCVWLQNGPFGEQEEQRAEPGENG